MRFAILLQLFLVSVAIAQVPSTISYQGVLDQNDGTAVTDGNYKLNFKLTNSPENNALLWEETHEAVEVVNGIFNVILGSVNPLDLLFDETYYLGVSVNDGAVLQPLIELTGSPYSFNARSVADSAIIASKIADGQVVRSINTLTDDVNLVAGDNVTVTNQGSDVVISSSAGGGISIPFFARSDESTTMFTLVNDGSGTVANLQSFNIDAITPVLDVTHRGRGIAGAFVNTSESNNSVALYVETLGSNAAVSARISENGNTAPAIEAITEGQGPGLSVKHHGSAGNIAEFSTLSGTPMTIDREGNIATSGHVDVGSKIIFPDGTEQITAAMGTGQYWNLTGNANANPDTAFIGTIDLQPFEIRVNNIRALRLEPASASLAATANVIAGGLGNEVDSGVVGGTISGGGSLLEGNRVSGDYGTVGGGYSSQAAFRAFVGGGSNNNAAGNFAVVTGGQQNMATGLNATVAGGKINQASDEYTTVAGGESNMASDTYATVSGGNLNEASDSYSTVGGGQQNKASGHGTTVSGGINNSANQVGDTVGGGFDNLAGSVENGPATIGGGEENKALDDYTTIAGGRQNTVTGSYGTIGGGEDNVVSGQRATVPGGGRNHARGSFSFAAGYNARAIHNGSFVWNDRSVTSGDDSLHTTADNQFLIRAEGGVGIGTDRPNFPLQMASGAHVTLGGVWTNASSRAYKENIADLGESEALAALQQLIPVKYNYRTEQDEDYLGFIAEDVPELVATQDRKSLSPMDIVALLTKVVQTQQAMISKLQQEVAGLNQQR